MSELAHKWSSRVRINLGDTLTRRDVRALVDNGDLKVLQCSTPIKRKTWKLLNHTFFTKRPDVLLRVWGFHSKVCDLSFSSEMTNVRYFSADCLTDAVGLEHIAAMDGLESLGVGIFHLVEFGFLTQVTRKLKKLFLGQTKSKKPDLTPLGRFESLEELSLDGQQKNITVLSDLENLQDLTLRSISTPDISYLSSLDRIWSLDIKLGGIRDLSAIEEMENIKYLELWQIRGLSDIGFVSSLTGLQHIFLQSLRRVTTLPAFDRLGELRRIVLENMKGLENLDSLEYAPALEECLLVNARNLQPEDCMPLFRNPNLRRAFGGFGSQKKNKRFNELMQEHNIEPLRGFRKDDFDLGR